MKQVTLPEDLKLECVGICRGYERRRRSVARRLTAARARGREEDYRHHPETRKLEAVQAVLEHFGPAGRPLLLSITDHIPYEKLEVPMGRSLFYRSRRAFLEEVARNLGYWE